MNAETLPPRLVIRADTGSAFYWRELWAARGLLFWLAWRDLLLRYKQTAVGLVWVVIRPLLTLGIFTLVFGRLAKLPSEGLPYSLLVFTGLLPWLFFAGAVMEAGHSLLGQAGLLGKVYFPRLILPLASIVVMLVELAVGLLLLIGLLIWQGHCPDTRVWTLPLWGLLLVLATLGPAIGLAALMVRFRDLRHAAPFLLQVGLYASPVAFSAHLIPESWRIVYALNPMVGVIEGFRWALGGVPFSSSVGMGVSVSMTLALLVFSVKLFRAGEREFADRV